MNTPNNLSIYKLPNIINISSIYLPFPNTTHSITSNKYYWYKHIETYYRILCSCIDHIIFSPLCYIVIINTPNNLSMYKLLNTINISSIYYPFQTLSTQ
jgi:hypothetical protein